MNLKIKSAIEVLVIVVLFTLMTILVQSNIDYFTDLIGGDELGILIYIVIVILAIVIAPLTSIPLIPLISNVYGWPIAGIASVIGWTLGSIIAFLLARIYGVKIVERIIPLKYIYRIENKIPKENLFLTVIFLRMVTPVDILSYALGLFTKMRFWPYLFATFIGVIPVTFILAYLGTINSLFQLIVYLIIGIIILIGLILKKRN